MVNMPHYTNQRHAIEQYRADLKDVTKALEAGKIHQNVYTISRVSIVRRIEESSLTKTISMESSKNRST
jgi:hypothetical protein